MLSTCVTYGDATQLAVGLHNVAHTCTYIDLSDCVAFLSTVLLSLSVVRSFPEAPYRIQTQIQIHVCDLRQCEKTKTQGSSRTFLKNDGLWLAELSWVS